MFQSSHAQRCRLAAAQRQFHCPPSTGRTWPFSGELDDVLLADNNRLIEGTKALERLSVNCNNAVSRLEARCLGRAPREYRTDDHRASRCRILIAHKTWLSCRLPHMLDPQDAIGRGGYGKEDRQQITQQPAK